jgi:hypothetical protein
VLHVQGISLEVGTQCTRCQTTIKSYHVQTVLRHGSVMRPAPSQPQTTLFKDLLTGEALSTAQNRESEENIRHLNSHMSFASLCTTKTVTVAGRGPYCFKVEGQMIRRLSTAQARQDHITHFPQVYFYDPAEADASNQHPRYSKWC